MLAGALRKRVVIQSRTTSQDSFGQQVIVWTDVLAGDVIGAPVSIASVTRGTTTTLGFAAAHGFPAGALVTLAGITGSAGLLATFAIQNVTGTTFDIAFDTTGLTLGIGSATATQVSGVPASISPLYAFEKMGQGQASEVHQVCIRWAPALSNPVDVAAMRVVYGLRLLDINGSINTDERNREVNLTCTEGLTRG